MTSIGRTNTFTDDSKTLTPTQVENEIKNIVESWNNHDQNILIPGFLKVLQIVTASYSTEVSSTSGTYADTGLTKSITPLKSTSRILVLIMQSVKATLAGIQTAAIGGYKVVRGTTTIAANDRAWGFNEGAATFTGSQFTSLPIFCVDSPAVTTATTYKTQFASEASGDGTVYVQPGGAGTNPSFIILAELQ